jgi:hypothetical protein
MQFDIPGAAERGGRVGIRSDWHDEAEATRLGLRRRWLVSLDRPLAVGADHDHRWAGAEWHGARVGSDLVDE